MSLKITVSAGVRGEIAKEGDFVNPRATVIKTALASLSTGAGAGQASMVFADTRSITASGNDDLDLAGGLTDPFGSALTFAKVKALMVIASAANTNDVVVGGASSNAFNGPFGASTHKVALPPGGFLMVTAPDADGWEVVPSTGDLLRIANGGGTTAVGYDIIVIGA